MDYESRMLLQGCQAQQHLLSTYSALTRNNAEQHEPMEVGEEDMEKQVRSKLLICRSISISNSVLVALMVMIVAVIVVVMVVVVVVVAAKPVSTSE